MTDLNFDTLKYAILIGYVEVDSQVEFDLLIDKNL